MLFLCEILASLSFVVSLLAWKAVVLLLVMLTVAVNALRT